MISRLKAQGSRLKATLEGELLVYASFPLVDALPANRLVDELRLMTYPLVLGRGRRLFGDPGRATPLRLVAPREVAGDVAHLIYSPIERSPAP